MWATPGRLATMARPQAGDWLGDEIAGWKQAGLDGVVSLLERDEEGELGLGQEAALCGSQGIEFISFPIKDYSLPTSPGEAERLVRETIATLRAGRKNAIHCRAGIGRSSVIAACTLIGLGLQPEDALARIGRARGLRVPDTEAQRRWVLEFRMSPHDRRMRLPLVAGQARGSAVCAWASFI